MRPCLGTDIISHLHVPTGKEAADEADPPHQAPPRAGQRAAIAAAADPRDPDIAHAHQVARRTSRCRARRAQPDRRVQPAPIPGSR
jgi:hypothetical protein